MTDSYLGKRAQSMTDSIESVNSFHIEYDVNSFKSTKSFDPEDWIRVKFSQIALEKNINLVELELIGSDTLSME